ncbi:MAG: hypothetical protein Fur002_19750 [Anaerolineales bacterium]
MIIQVVYLEAREDDLEKFIREASLNAAESKKETGVVQFDLLQQEDAPTRFMLYEIYQDEAALQAHRETAHFKRWVEVGVPLLAKPRERNMYALIC